jgi:hypothetical protein
LDEDELDKLLRIVFFFLTFNNQLDFSWIKHRTKLNRYIGDSLVMCFLQKHLRVSANMKTPFGCSLKGLMGLLPRPWWKEQQPDRASSLLLCRNNADVVNGKIIPKKNVVFQGSRKAYFTASLTLSCILVRL